MRVFSQILWVTLAWAVLLPAQRYSFREYGTREGLHNLAVLSLLQDSTGFLWAGTQNGLYQFDGVRFHEYNLSHGLPGNYVDSIHQSKDGTLWVGTQSGLYRRVDRTFGRVIVLDSNRVRGSQGVASDSQGHIYVATERGIAYGELTAAGWRFR